ncbi:putative short-chain dehydrogenases/reductase [Aspergillus karnatakaensis]|uniref:putative short-chain dehydrogenases/reductase n=1 Tax=Aspergillus karnatakaensis TaxID=1810916 RepID=UPI003CCD4367
MPPRTVLITGCTTNSLGSEMAKAYHSHGYTVIATLRNKSKSGSLSETKGIHILELEVTSPASIRACATAVAGITGGSLDILVNNAGVNHVIPLLDVEIEDAKKTYDVNVWGMLSMAQAFAPMLMKARGTMCNVSSVSGEMVFAWAGIYSSSRAAQTRLSETLRLELAPLGVRVVTVILGGVETQGNNPANIPDLELPGSSHYREIIDIIDRHKKTQVHQNKQNIETAARNIVGDVLSGKGWFIRRGMASTTSWVCNTFLPYGTFTWLINRESGIERITIGGKR